MNLEEFTGINPLKDWTGYMLTALEKLPDVGRFIPFGLSTLRTNYKNDRHLNNLSIARWDAATGCAIPGNPQAPKRPIKASTGLVAYLAKEGITQVSLSQCVSLLKHEAEIMVLSDIVKQEMKAGLVKLIQDHETDQISFLAASTYYPLPEAYQNKTLNELLDSNETASRIIAMEIARVIGNMEKEPLPESIKLILLLHEFSWKELKID